MSGAPSSADLAPHDRPTIAPTKVVDARPILPPKTTVLAFPIWVCAFGLAACLSETSRDMQAIAILSITALCCTTLAVTLRPRLAAYITFILTLMVWIVSRVKIAYLGAPLAFGDLVHLLGYNFWWTVSNYPELGVAGAVGVVGLTAFSIWITRRPSHRVSVGAAFCSASCALAIAVVISKSSENIAFWNQEFDRTNAGIGTFATSTVWWWHTGGNAVTMYGVAAKPLDQEPTPPAALTGPKPNIFMVLEESVFDPRQFGLPIENDAAQYFTPAEGLSGPLRVNTHGGGTWITEFSAMSGLDSRSFGDKVFYLPKLMENRVHHNFIRTLDGLGYRTVIIYCVDGRFMNAENFYRSLGAQEFIVPDRAAGQEEIWYFQDSELYQHALNAMSSRRQDESGRPVFVMVVTISNHGSHDTKLVGEGAFPDTRAWIDRNVPDPEYDEYREYYLRLKQSIADYRSLKSELASRFENRPTLVVRFGDHQPLFTKNDAAFIATKEDQQLFATYFALEMINGDLANRPDWGAGPLDVAYLPTLVLDAAGLPLDQIHRVRKQLMESCSGLYFRCSDERIGRLHRTLLDRGLIEVDHIEVEAIEPRPMFH